MDALIVRDADLEDLAAVAALRWQWVLANGCDPVVDGQTFITAFQNWALAHTATHWCAVAIRTDQVVGMAWLALTDRVPSPRSLERTTADVQCVYVVPAERNRGVAQRLMDAVVAQGHRWGSNGSPCIPASRRFPCTAALASPRTTVFSTCRCSLAWPLNLSSRSS